MGLSSGSRTLAVALVATSVFLLAWWRFVPPGLIQGSSFTRTEVTFHEGRVLPPASAAVPSYPLADGGRVAHVTWIPPGLEGFEGHYFFLRLVTDARGQASVVGIAGNYWTCVGGGLHDKLWGSVRFGHSSPDELAVELDLEGDYRKIGPVHARIDLRGDSTDLPRSDLPDDWSPWPLAGGPESGR